MDDEKFRQSNDPGARAVVPLLGNVSENVRSEASTLLAEIAHHNPEDPEIIKAIPNLIDAAKDYNPGVRANAICALGAIGTEIALDTVISALDDMDENVRRFAVNTLGKIGKKVSDSNKFERIVRAITSMNSDQCVHVTDQVEFALEKIGEPLVPILRKMLDDENPSVKLSAAKSLIKFGNSTAVPELRQALRDGNYSIRAASASALGKIGDPNAVPDLIEALNDDYSGVRNASAWALGLIKDERVLEPLVLAVKERDPCVRESALYSLWNFSHSNPGALRNAIPALLSTLQDYNLQKVTARILKDIGFEHLELKYKIKCLLVLKRHDDLIQLGEQAVPALIEELKHADPFTRMDMAEILDKVCEPSLAAVISLYMGGNVNFENVEKVCIALNIELNERNCNNGKGGQQMSLDDLDKRWATKPTKIPTKVESKRGPKMKLKK